MRNGRRGGHLVLEDEVESEEADLHEVLDRIRPIQSSSNVCIVIAGRSHEYGLVGKGVLESEENSDMESNEARPKNCRAALALVMQR